MSDDEPAKPKDYLILVLLWIAVFMLFLAFTNRNSSDAHPRAAWIFLCAITSLFLVVFILPGSPSDKKSSQPW
jgi:uncharacterized membrane protein YhaH (DUF805 family)